MNEETIEKLKEELIAARKQNSDFGELEDPICTIKELIDMLYLSLTPDQGMIIQDVLREKIQTLKHFYYEIVQPKACQKGQAKLKVVS